MKTLLKFKCGHCRKIFDAEGTREEWTSPTYGPCWELKAPCPSCAAPAKEYRSKARVRPSGEGGEGEGSGESFGESGPCGEGACDAGEGPSGQDFGDMGD